MAEQAERYVTDEATSKRMSAIRPLETTPEVAVRRFLTALKYRYRLNRYDLPGRPDIVFPGRRKVLFVHGCYWHRHAGCFRTTTPIRNVEMWRKKFQTTVERDLRNVRLLTEQGWQSFVIWECQIRTLEALRHQLEAFLNGEDGHDADTQ
jgi:DNA mismatch endonuclease (patch repair protein)